MQATAPDPVSAESAQTQSQGREAFSGGVREHVQDPPEGLRSPSWHQPPNSSAVTVACSHALVSIALSKGDTTTRCLCADTRLRCNAPRCSGGD